MIDYRIENRAKQIVGGSLRSKISYGLRQDIGVSYYEGSFFSGPIVFLPPPTKVTAEEGIDTLLNVLLGGELTEAPPRWDSKIDLPRLNALETQIAQKEKEKNGLIIEIEKLNLKKKDTIKLRRLLWADGEPLASAVKDAFVSLGFARARALKVQLEKLLNRIYLIRI